MISDVPAAGSDLVGVEPSCSSDRRRHLGDRGPDHLGELRRLLRGDGVSATAGVARAELLGTTGTVFHSRRRRVRVKDGIDRQIAGRVPAVSSSAAVEQLQQSRALVLRKPPRRPQHHVRRARIEHRSLRNAGRRGTVTGVGREAITDDFAAATPPEDLRTCSGPARTVPGSRCFAGCRARLQDERIAYDWSEGCVDWHPKDLPCALLLDPSLCRFLPSSLPA